MMGIPPSKLVSDEDGHWFVIRVFEDKIFQKYLDFMAGKTDEDPGFEPKRVDGPGSIYFFQYRPIRDLDPEQERKEYHLQVAYPLTAFIDHLNDNGLDVDAVIRACVGCENEYGGAGGSWAGGESLDDCKAMRDIGFVFYDFDDAHAAHKRVAGLPIDGIRVRIRPD